MVDLDVVFRSIVNFKNSKGKETISQSNLLKNFRAMQQVIPEAPEEKTYTILYHFIFDFLRSCKSSEPELPSYEFVKNFFQTEEGNEAVLAILEKIKAQQPYLGQDYHTILRMYNDDQNILRFERVLTNSNKIAAVGLEIGTGRKKQKLKGIRDAVSYFARETKELQREVSGIKTEGQIVSVEDSDEMIGEYERAEKDPTESLGVNTWLTQIDDATGGLKNTELMIAAAFTGHCKTTFCMNMAYRALYGGWNTAFTTLEMTYDEIRRHLYCLHACNPKFRKTHPKYAKLVGKLKYNDIRYGRLSPQEKEYWYFIIRDFNRNFNEDSDTYGRLFVWQPEKAVTTVSDVELKMRTWQQELQASGRDLEFSILDYITLLGAEKGDRTQDHNQTLNNIIISLKRLCVTFNNGKGTRMLSPFQVNRAGYREALANEGRYYLTALSNAHEAERSADIVASLFKFDEDNNSNRLKICGLKCRRNKVFSPFDACIDFETGFIYNLPDSVEQATNIDMSGVLNA